MPQVTETHQASSSTTSLLPKNKKTMAKICVPLVFLAFIVSSVIAIPAVLQQRQQLNKELRLLHIVMRHGARAPVSTYPRDPLAGEDYAPNGWGQLTNKGISSLYNFGKYIRNRYDSFLGDRFDPMEFYCESTGVDRTIASMMTVNSGIWRPQGAQKWSKKFDWFPVPVYSTPIDDDMLLLVRRDCPQYNIELEAVTKSHYVSQQYQKYDKLFRHVEYSTGQKIETFFDLEDIYTTLLAEQAFGLALPTWTAEPIFSEMKKAAAFSFVMKAYNGKMQRLSGGVLLKKILNDYESNISGRNDKRKAFLYGGHDTTISNLLSTLDIFDPQVPDYGMAVILEMYLNRETNEFGVEILVKNTTSEPFPMVIPGCDRFCSLERFVNLTEPKIPKDWGKECATDDPNYVRPKQMGP